MVGRPIPNIARLLPIAAAKSTLERRPIVSTPSGISQWCSPSPSAAADVMLRPVPSTMSRQDSIGGAWGSWKNSADLPSTKSRSSLTCWGSDLFIHVNSTEKGIYVWPGYWKDLLGFVSRCRRTRRLIDLRDGPSVSQVVVGELLISRSMKVIVAWAGTPLSTRERRYLGQSCASPSYRFATYHTRHEQFVRWNNTPLCLRKRIQFFSRPDPSISRPSIVRLDAPYGSIPIHWKIGIHLLSRSHIGDASWVVLACHDLGVVCPPHRA